jgi:excisionase family DNA binding protein
MFDPKTLDQLSQAIAARIIPQMPPSGGDSNGSPKMPPRLLNIKQAAASLGLSVGALYHLVARREIPFVKFGRTLRFDVRDLDRWIQNGKV